MTHMRCYQQTIIVILCNMIDRERARLGYVGGTGVQTFKHGDVIGCPSGVFDNEWGMPHKWTWNNREHEMDTVTNGWTRMLYSQINAFNK